MKNSCGKRGCDSTDSDRITLPNDGRTIRVRGKMHGRGHDIKLVSQVINELMGSKRNKKCRMAKVVNKAIR